MNLLEHTSPQSILYFMLYGGAAALCVVLCLYMLLRRGNAIAPDITPPMRLRRWTAAFFAVGALGHTWWFLLYLYFRDDQIIYDTGNTPGNVIGAVLDCVAMLITIAGTLLAMLQDRHRPVWPIVVVSIPIAVLGALQLAYPAKEFLIPALVYALVVYVAFTVYMAFAVRQYGRWLLDNYADLEHKEVWLSHTLVLLLLLGVIFYGFADDNPSFFLIRIADFVLFGILLWRVETLPSLTPVPTPKERKIGMSSAEEQESTTTSEGTETVEEQTICSLPSQGGGSAVGSLDLAQIEQLLKEHCVAPQLYLQHDLTLQQLAQAIGTNRSYLSQYFSRQSITYNTYINNLRINHFITLCQEATAAGQTIVAQQLASDSGYRSYSTFSLAFKQRTGQTVTAWLRETGGVIL